MVKPFQGCDKDEDNLLNEDEITACLIEDPNLAFLSDITDIA